MIQKSSLKALSYFFSISLLASFFSVQPVFRANNVIVFMWLIYSVLPIVMNSFCHFSFMWKKTHQLWLIQYYFSLTHSPSLRAIFSTFVRYNGTKSNKIFSFVFVGVIVGSIAAGNNKPASKKYPIQILWKTNSFWAKAHTILFQDPPKWPLCVFSLKVLFNTRQRTEQRCRNVDGEKRPINIEREEKYNTLMISAMYIMSRMYRTFYYYLLWYLERNVIFTASFRSYRSFFFCSHIAALSFLHIVFSKSLLQKKKTSGKLKHFWWQTQILTQITNDIWMSLVKNLTATFVVGDKF